MYESNLSYRLLGVIRTPCRDIFSSGARWWQKCSRFDEKKLVKKRGDEETGLWRFCSCQVIAVLVNLLCRWPHISAPYSQHLTIRTHFFTCQLLLQPQKHFFPLRKWQSQSSRSLHCLDTTTRLVHPDVKNWKTKGYTTLHSIYCVPLVCAVVCPMTMFAGSWLEVRRLLVWSAEAAAKGAACIKISSLGFRFCCHHSENHLYCTFRGVLHSKPSDSP